MKEFKIIEDVVLLSQKLESVGNWALTGSANLYLHGIKTAVNDIDLICCLSEVTNISNALSNFCVREISYQETDLIKSHYGRFRLSNYCLDVFADDIKNRTNQGWVSRSGWKEAIEIITISSCEKVPTLSVGYELKIYELINDVEKIKMIQEKN